MKIFAFIMAFLVLALSVIPCADKENTINEGKAKTGLTKMAPQHNDTQQDECSPFCHCGCCAGFYINHFIASVAIIHQYENKQISIFSSSDVMEVALPIWQPPQLV